MTIEGGFFFCLYFNTYDLNLGTFHACGQLKLPLFTCQQFQCLFPAVEFFLPVYYFSIIPKWILLQPLLLSKLS